MSRYVAYNIRTIYLFSAYIIFIIIIINIYIKRKVYLIPGIIAFLVGYVLIALLQIVINKTYYDVISTAVIIQYAGDSNLFLFQLNTGLELQFYATYVGDTTIYPSAAMRFNDEFMIKFIQKEGIERFTSITDYIIFCIKHPIIMIGVYNRHFINCLNPMFGEVYIKDLYKRFI